MIVSRFSWLQSCARSEQLHSPRLKRFNISNPSYLGSRPITMAMSRDVNNSVYWKEIPASSDCPSYSVYTGPINKSELDSREYRIVQLPNQLQAVLIHEANADKAAACVHVAAGHLQDPVSSLSAGTKIETELNSRSQLIVRRTRASSFSGTHDIEGNSRKPFSLLINNSVYETQGSTPFPGEADFLSVTLLSFSGYLHL